MCRVIIRMSTRIECRNHNVQLEIEQDSLQFIIILTNAKPSTEDCEYRQRREEEKGRVDRLSKHESFQSLRHSQKQTKRGQSIEINSLRDGREEKRQAHSCTEREGLRKDWIARKALSMCVVQLSGSVLEMGTIGNVCVLVFVSCYQAKSSWITGAQRIESS